MIVFKRITIEFEVEAEFTPAERGHRDRFGAPEEPDIPAEFGITSIDPPLDQVSAMIEEKLIKMLKDE